MKTQYNWKPLIKKGQPTSLHSFQVPQPVGIPGWLLLTHNSDHQACAFFVDARGTQTPERVPMILDDRLCSDTVIRVIRLSKSIFVCCDIWVLCGRNFHERFPYSKRLETLSSILDLMHSPDLTALVTPQELPCGTLLRGTEHYDDQPGSLGVFLPAHE
jgi:hypothetical protein